MRTQKGFTLIELLVVTSIFIIVTGIVLASNSRFGGRVLLQNLAYDIALSIRQAQVYGISVRRFGTSTYSAGYAMHFSSANPTQYVLFADAIIPNGLYDGCDDAASCELVESTEIARGYEITDLCSTAGAGGAEVCGKEELDILFKRPEPDAYISANGVSGIANIPALQQRARIVVESPRGDHMSIVVEATGQIAIRSYE